VPTVAAPNTTTAPIDQTTLFNETRIGPFTNQQDIPVSGEDDNEMLWIVDDHRRCLKIDDSKEMMVGIAYGMPFELEQFGLFHVSMHIHRNPGPGLLNPLRTHITHSTCHMNQSDARLSQWF
jgi:hypothetical protein